MGWLDAHIACTNNVRPPIPLSPAQHSLHRLIPCGKLRQKLREMRSSSMVIVQCATIDVYVNGKYRCVEGTLGGIGCLLPKTGTQHYSTMAPTYTISDLAKEFDLTTRAIRFYEDMGLLQPERNGSAGRNRVYSARDRTRLRLTLRAKRLGLSLTEAKGIIDLYDSPRDTGVQLRKCLDVLVVHRRQLEDQMADLQANLEEVQEHEKEARDLLLEMENKNR